MQQRCRDRSRLRRSSRTPSSTTPSSRPRRSGHPDPPSRTTCCSSASSGRTSLEYSGERREGMKRRTVVCASSNGGVVVRWESSAYRWSSSVRVCGLHGSERSWTLTSQWSPHTTHNSLALSPILHRTQPKPPHPPFFLLSHSPPHPFTPHAFSSPVRRVVGDEPHAALVFDLGQDREERPGRRGERGGHSELLRGRALEEVRHPRGGL